jgi:amidohydrolase
VDSFTLVVKGDEAHGAYPHQGFDAIVLSAQVINALQTVISRRLDPTEGRVITIGTIEGGTKDNIITGKVTMTGSIRTFDPKLRESLFAEMERACGVARALGGDFELTIHPGFMAIVNDPAMTELVRETGADLLGEENVREAALEMGAEDFSYFAERAPGCFFTLGGAVAEGPPRMHHHPRFDVDERCLPVGAAIMAEAALRYLRRASEP